MKTPQADGESRRNFLSHLVCNVLNFSVIAAVTRRLGFSQNKPKEVLTTIKLSENKDLEKVGGYVLVKDTTAGDVLLVHSAETQYTALSNICPHKGCKVEVKSPSLIQCPCHQSAYKIDGTYIGGPSKTSLKKFAISLNGDVLNVSDVDTP